MLVYLSARYPRFPELQGYAKELQALGHTVTSRWIRGDHELRAHGDAEHESWQTVWALENWADLEDADTVILFADAPEADLSRARAGHMVEWGMALALFKQCLVIGSRDNLFFFLPQVHFYPTWQACLAGLQEST